MKKIKQIISLVVAMSLVLTNITFGVEIDTNINITSNVEPTDVNREFQVTYNMTVDATTDVESPSVVLVLDRSGSMLFKDYNGDLVVDTVKSAVNQFITSYFLNNSGGRLAIVSFGTYVNVSNYGNYYSRASDALAAVNYIYEYNYSYYSGYYWNHWYSSQGGTNIGEAFDKAAATVENHYNSDSNEVIILFSDGVANIYKNYYNQYYSTSNYPTYENSSTRYAYTEGQNAQDVADVITVGYFGAYNHYPETKALAKSTLENAQNAGFYTTDELSQVDDLFETILNSIDYLGTDSKVTEVVNADFEVIPESIEPSGATITVDPINGQTTIEWDIGNLYLTDYEFTYKIKAKDNSYPSGKEDVLVNDISVAGAGLTYKDLDNVMQFEKMPQLVIDVPSHDIVPGVDLRIVHETSEFKEYLIGDTAVIDHNLTFSNDLLGSEFGDGIQFDFVRIDVQDYSKELVYPEDTADVDIMPFTEAFKVNNTGWTRSGDVITQVIDESATSDDPSTLLWNKTLQLEMTCLEAGEFDFLHSINYNLYNEYSSNPFEISLNNLVEDEIKVANGTIKFNLDDEFGNPITNVNVILLKAGTSDVILESEDYERATVVDGNYTMDHIPTNSYDMILEVPSGYKIADGYTYNLNADGNIFFTNVSLNYDNPLRSYSLHFETLDVGNISIRTAQGDSQIYRNNTTDDINVVMTFKPMSNMEVMQLPIVDTLALNGQVSINPATLVVKNAAGNVVGGFAFTGNTLTFDKSRTGAPAYLPAGDYTATFVITSLPSSLSGQVITVGGITKPAPGFVFDLTVVETYSRGVGVSSIRNNDTSARELTIVYDEVGPAITITVSESQYTGSNVTVDVSIISELTEIVDYRLVRVNQPQASISSFSGATYGGGFASTDDTNAFHITGDFEVTIREEDIENPLAGIYQGNGYFAVMATDQAGNTTIKTIAIANLININLIEDLL